MSPIAAVSFVGNLALGAVKTTKLKEAAEKQMPVWPGAMRIVR